MDLDKLKNHYSLSLLNKHQPLRDSILTCFHGSIAHKMHIPNTDPNSVDDIDIISVTIAPKSCYFGLDTWGSRGTEEFWDGDWDVVCYELTKFVSLMEKSNPNVLSMLWCDEEFVIHSTPWGKTLRQSRDLFTTKNVYHSFCGYANAQLEQMTRGQNLGYMGAKRRGLVEKYGYDTKNAAHLIRLLKMGIEFLRDGRLYVSRTNDCDELLAIKTGKFSLEEVKEMANDLFSTIHGLGDRCEFPLTSNRTLINQMLADIFEGWFYGQKS